MDLPAKKIGILLSTAPCTAAFREGLQFASRVTHAGNRVFVYCIHDAVTGVSDPVLQGLRNRGLVLHACAFAAKRRGQPVNDLACYGGLGTLGDLIAATHEFRHFGGTGE